jgi:MtN3 and saliva related transmembrane protein
MIDFIGYLSAFLTSVSFLPQAIKTIKTKNTEGISLLMYLLFVIGVIGWTIYGFLIENNVIIIANIFTTIVASMVLFVKIYNTFKN